jgi:hypothetical protein
MHHILKSILTILPSIDIFYTFPTHRTSEKEISTCNLVPNKSYMHGPIVADLHDD